MTYTRLSDLTIEAEVNTVAPRISDLTIEAEVETVAPIDVRLSDLTIEAEVYTLDAETSNGALYRVTSSRGRLRHRINRAGL
jgi:hypothetical protein